MGDTNGNGNGQKLDRLERDRLLTEIATDTRNTKEIVVELKADLKNHLRVDHTKLEEKIDEVEKVAYNNSGGSGKIKALKYGGFGLGGGGLALIVNMIIEYFKSGG